MKHVLTGLVMCALVFAVPARAAQPSTTPAVQAADQKQLDQARAKLKADNYALGSLVGSIVTSPQFLNKRGKDDTRE